ncbi:replicative DNA helicase [Laspinema palackyanum]|uniref:replicative DNA helicase n=1 Tax=Laspinema palackyanum TaxID=3231601 RepID=UPI00345CEA33|nr:replicative DNA helicase [Laspinema sp. D2c]
MAETLNFQGYSDRLPPQNIDAEESILGGILLDPEAITRVLDRLPPDGFSITAHQQIYKAAIALHFQGKATDLMTVTSWLADHKLLEQVGGQSKLAQLVERTVSAVNIDQYAELVVDKYMRRKLIQGGHQVAELGFDTTTELATLLDKAEQTIFSLTQDRPQQGLVSISETLIQTFENIEIHQQGLALPGLTCGFYDLDAMTGGLQRSDLIIIAGRPAMGKTSFALNLGRNIAEFHKLPVAVFSLEMSKEQLVQRMLSGEAGIESNRLRSGRIAQNEWEALSIAIGNLSELPLFIDDTPNITITDIRSKCRRLQAEQGGQMGLILLDYLQLMEGSSPDNRVQELSRITRGLKQLARELNVPIITLSQLSRGVEARTNKRPMMSDLRESGCLTGDSLITLADRGVDVPIRDLVGQSGFAVWALNPVTMQLERAIVSHAFCTGVKPVFKLTTRLGRQIRATGNHQFLAIDGWKRLDELQKGDRLALPRQLPSSSVRSYRHPELALLGHLIGDGCTLPRHAIQYTTREKDLADLVVSLAVEVFGDLVKPRIVKERDWYQVYLAASYHLTHKVRNPVVIWLESMGVFGLRSYEKYVPKMVFEQPPEEIALFLRHLWSTDGCIKTSKVKNSYPAVYYTSSSPKLSQNVQALLLRLGINARLSVSPQPGKGREQHQVWVSGKPDLEKFITQIGAVGDYKQQALQEVANYLEVRSGNTNRDVIPHEIWRMYAVPAMQRSGKTIRQMQAQLGVAHCGTSLYKKNVSRDRAAKLATVVQSEEITRLANSDVYWDEIVAIAPDGETEVFDLTVPVHHNFIANNIIAHNSIEQDSDIVVMLYREEYYNPDTPDRGIAEVIITKHRNGPTGTIKLLFDPQFTKFKNLARPQQHY